MGGYPQISDEVTSEVLRLYREEGLGGRKIAARTGVGVTTVYSVLRRAGVKRDAGTRSAVVTMEATAENIVKLYNDGLSGPEIGAQLGVPYSVIYRRLVAAGIKASKSGRRAKAFRLTEAQEAEIVVLYEQGILRKTLATQFGCNPWTIRNILKRKGIARRYPPIDINPSERAVIAERYTNGESQTAMALEYGVDQTTISRIVASAGASKQRFRGGRTSLPHGYVGVLVPWDSPFASMRLSNGYVPEHRLIMAQSLGRPLRGRKETVHHINGNRRDNRLENLQLRQGQHGAGVVHRCQDCGSTNVVAVPIAGGIENDSGPSSIQIALDGEPVRVKDLIRDLVEHYPTEMQANTTVVAGQPALI